MCPLLHLNRRMLMWSWYSMAKHIVIAHIIAKFLSFCVSIKHFMRSDGINQL